MRMAQTTSDKSQRELVPLAVAGEMFGVCTKTVRRMVERGHLTGFRYGRRVLRVDANEVRALIEASMSTAGQ